MEFIKKLMVTNITLSKEVSGFSFPNDWYKIRQMMEERRRKEQVCSDQTLIRVVTTMMLMMMFIVHCNEFDKRLQEGGFWSKSQIVRIFGSDLELVFDEL